MVFAFFIWYSRPACGGPRRGEKESGDTPEPLAMGLRPPAPPLFASPAAGREEGRKSRGTPPNPWPWDCVPRHPLSSLRLRRAAKRGERVGDTPEPPAMGLRPPAPPLFASPAAGGKRGKKEAEEFL